MRYQTRLWAGSSSPIVASVMGSTMSFQYWRTRLALKDGSDITSTESAITRPIWSGSSSLNPPQGASSKPNRLRPLN